MPRWALPYPHPHFPGGENIFIKGNMKSSWMKKVEPSSAYLQAQMFNNCDLIRSPFRVMKPIRDDSGCRLRPSLGLCLPHLLSPDLGLSPMLPSVLLTAWHSLLFITSASTCLCLWWAHSVSCSPKHAYELRVLITAFLTNIVLPNFFGIDTGLAQDTHHSYIITRIPGAWS